MQGLQGCRVGVLQRVRVAASHVRLRFWARVRVSVDLDLGLGLG